MVNVADLSDELLDEVADRMAPDFEAYKVIPAMEVFTDVQAEREADQKGGEE